MPTLKNPSRLQLWFKGKKVLADPKATLADLHITAGSTVYAEDRGVQISYRMVSLASIDFLE